MVSWNCFPNYKFVVPSIVAVCGIGCYPGKLLPLRSLDVAARNWSEFHGEFKDRLRAIDFSAQWPNWNWEVVRRNLLLKEFGFLLMYSYFLFEFYWSDNFTGFFFRIFLLKKTSHFQELIVQRILMFPFQDVRNQVNVIFPWLSRRMLYLSAHRLYWFISECFVWWG